MAVSKVILNGETLMDVTVDTVTSEKLLTGYQATGRDGVKVQGAYVPQSVELAAGSADPSESAQHITPPSGYDGFEYFDVGAVSSNYVGSNIAQRSSSDLTASGSVVTAPSGYYAAAASKAINAGSATTPATSITTTPTITVSSTGLVTAEANSSKSITPTVSAGYISSGTAGTVTASGSNTLQLSTQSAATINPTESVQTAVASGKYTTGVVSVGAISSNYIGSNIPQNDSSDLTASGSKVTVPSGYYAAVASKTIAAGSATTPATTITANPGITVSATGLITATNSKTQNVTPTVTAGYVSAGTSGTITVDGSNTSQLSTQAAATITPTESEQTAVASGKYTTGIVKVAAVPSDYVGSNVPTHDSSDLSVNGAVVTVPSGYYEAAASTAIPSGTLTNSQKQIGGSVGTVSFNSATGNFTVSRTTDFYPLTVTITDAGYFAEGSIQTGYFQINAASTSYQLNTQAAATITPIESSQIAVASGKYTLGDVTVAAVSSDYIGSNIAQNSASDVTVSGPTVSVLSGYYGTEVNKTVKTVALDSGINIPFLATISVNSQTGLITAQQGSTTTTYPISESGYVEKTSYEIKVSGSTTSQLSTQASTIITPTESSQVAVASGKFTTGPVTVAAIPSDYIGSAIASVEVVEGITTVSGSSADRGVATWSAGVIASGSIGAATFANTSSGQTQYVDISNTTEAPVLVSGGYLYINKGYTDDLKISLAKLVPDGANADLSSDKILSGYAAYDNDGNLVAGNIPSKSSANVTVAGPTVSIPSGYYGVDVIATIPNGKIVEDSYSIGSLNIGNISLDTSNGLISIDRSRFDYTIKGRISQSGYLDKDTEATNTFTVSAKSTTYQLSTQSAAIITPTESSQVAVASGKYTLGSITVAAISSNYVGSNIAQNSATDLIASGSVVSVPSGYYALDASAAIAAGSVQIGSLMFYNNPTINFDSSTGVITASVGGGIGVGASVTSGYVTSVVNGSVNVSGNSTLELTTASASTYTPSTATQTIPSGVYLTGAQTIAGDTALVASNIIQGATIFGVVGTAKTQPTLQSKTVTPSSTSQVITFDSGYDGLSSVTIEAIPISVVKHRLVLPDGLIGV